MAKPSNLSIVGNGAANRAATTVKKKRDRQAALIDEIMGASGLPIQGNKPKGKPKKAKS